jgi:hypothetical protein
VKVKNNLGRFLKRPLGFLALQATRGRAAASLVEELRQLGQQKTTQFAFRLSAALLLYAAVSRKANNVLRRAKRQSRAVFVVLCSSTSEAAKPSGL